MDANTTVAIDILIRTSMGNAAADFNKSLVRMEMEAKAWVNRMNAIYAKMKVPGVTGVTAGVSGGRVTAAGVDPAMMRAQADIQRMIKQRAGWETTYTQHVSTQAEKQFQARTKGIQKSAAEFQRHLNTARLAEAGFAQGATGFQSEFKKAASEASNLVGIFTGNRLSGATSQITSFSGAVGAIPGVVGAAVGVVAGLGVVITGLGVALFDMAKHAAEATGTLAAFQTKTGLGAETVSALSYAADLAHKNITDLQRPIVMFTKLIGDARAGNDKAIASLQKLNVTNFTDLQAALGQVFTHIDALPPGIDKINDAALAFGRRGGIDMINVIHKMGGDLSGFITLAKNLGVTLSQEDIDAAKKFNRTYETVMLQATIAAHKFALAYGDQISNAMQKVSDWLSRNKNEWHAWGVVIGNILNGVIKAVSAVGNWFGNHPWAMRLIPGFAVGETAASLLSYYGTDDQPIPSPGVNQKHMGGNSGVRFGTWSSITQGATAWQRQQTIATALGDDTDTDTGGGGTGGGGGRAAKVDLPKLGTLHALVISTGNTQWDAWLNQFGNAYGVDPNILALQLGKESSGKPGAISYKGATGLMQLMPSTFARMGVGANIKDPQQSIEAGAKYMGQLLGMFSGDYSLALAGYNAGEGAVLKYGGRVPPYKETKDYVAKITGRYASRVAPRGIGQDQGGGFNFGTASDEATKAERDAQTRRAMQTFLTLGMTPPPELMKRFQDVLTEDAKRGTDVTGRGIGIQPTEQDVAQKFLLSKRGAPITDTGGQILGPEALRPRLTADQEYVNAFKDSFKWEERLTDQVFKERNTEALIKLTLEDQARLRGEALAQNKIDLGVAQGRNTQEETYLKYQQSVTVQINKQKDIEGDLGTLQMQNADAEFVAQRRLLAAKDEEYNLQQQITEAGDQLTNQGVNDSLKVQLSLLHDIYDIREREVQAVMDTNRAQLEITNQTQYSATQANASVLKFMADQKGVTQIMGDFKIGLLESGYDLIDKGLDKILPKIGRLGQAIHDLIGSFIKLALNAAFRRIFGLDQGAGVGGGGGAKSGGGGIGGFLSNLFGIGGTGGGGTGGGTGGGSITGSIFGGAVGNTGIFNFGGGTVAGAATGSNLNPFQAAIASMGGIRALSGAPDIITPGGTPTLIGGAAGGIAGLGSGVTGIGTSLGAFSKSPLGKFLGSPLAAGGLAGLGLGVGLGRGSVTGSILGGVGGAALGIGATAAILGALTPGIFAGATATAAAGSLASLGPLAAFFTNPFTIGIGAALLIGAFIFSRKARAKKEKKQVDAWAGDALTKIQGLISDVKAFKITGTDAYNQGVGIRDQFVQSIAQLKDKGAKKHANDQLGQINGLLATLKTEGARSDRLSQIAQVTDQNIVPTFDVGGFTGFGYGKRLAYVDSHEVILRQQDVMAMGGYKRLQNAGVRGMPLTGASDKPVSNQRAATKSGGGDVHVAVFMDEASADAWLDNVSPLGVAKKVKMAARGNLAGMNDMLARRLSGN